MDNRPALLVDARNAIYRAVYAGMANSHAGIHYHFCVIFLRQLVSWIHRTDPSSVHIFWDAPRETVWRRQILPTYKDRSNSNYVEGLVEGLALTTQVLQDLCPHLGMRQYSRKHMEADDLLYAAVSVLHPKPTIIVSSDSDMLQIPFRYHSCSVLNPTENHQVTPPTVNPAHLKALTGDLADSINGYYNIGPKRGQALLEDYSNLQEFLRVKGSATYYLNLLLIDLSMCPRLLANTIYIQRQLAEPVTFTKSKVNELMMQHKINGLMQEYNDLVLPFMRFASAS
jgi:5'-3' exonuclease